MKLFIVQLQLCCYMMLLTAVISACSMHLPKLSSTFTCTYPSS